MRHLGVVALGLTAVTVSVSLSALAAPQAQSKQDVERRATAVATYSGGAVTVGEIEDTIADTSPLIQATALEPESLREFLDRNLRFELMLQEAERRGYRDDAEVLKAVKENAVQLMIAREVNAAIAADPPAPELVHAYFDSHRPLFSVPELRRVSALFVATEAEARALSPRAQEADAAAFSELVRARGLNVPSKALGGNLGRFEANGKPESGETQVDPKLASAAFALPALGSVSDVIRLDGNAGFAILKLTELRHGYVPSFDEVKVRVFRRFDDERYDKAVNAIAAARRAQLHPIVHAELVDPLSFD